MILQWLTGMLVFLRDQEQTDKVVQQNWPCVLGALVH